MPVISFYRGLLALLPAALFLCPFSRADDQLALELFEEEQWAACHYECLRVLSRDPDAEKIKLLDVLAQRRSGKKDESISSNLFALATSAAWVETRCLASYEWARESWTQGDVDAAFTFLKYTFENTESSDLFHRAACSLFLLRKEKSKLFKDDEDLAMQLDTLVPVFTDEIVRDCRIAPMRVQRTGPVDWIVGFYRSQISPAIGERCSLWPSCSEYFRLAGQKYGLLAFPLLADRVVREPDVVAFGETTMQINHQTRYEDPLSHHDHVLRGSHE